MNYNKNYSIGDIIKFKNNNNLIKAEIIFINKIISLKTNKIKRSPNLFLKNSRGLIKIKYV